MATADKMVDTPGSIMSMSPEGFNLTPKKSSVARRRIFYSPSVMGCTVTGDALSPLGCSTISLTPDSGNMGSPRRSPRLTKFASTPQMDKPAALLAHIKAKRKLIEDSSPLPVSKSKKARPSNKQVNKQVSKGTRDQRKRLFGGINAGVSHGIKKPKLKPLQESNTGKASTTKASGSNSQKHEQVIVPSIQTAFENVPPTSDDKPEPNQTVPNKKVEQLPADHKGKNKTTPQGPKVIITHNLHSLPHPKSSGPKKFFKSREENGHSNRVATVSLNQNLTLQLRETEQKKPLRRSPRKHKSPEKAACTLLDDWDEDDDMVSANITNIIQKLEINPSTVEVMDMSTNPAECESLIMAVDPSHPEETSNTLPEKQKLFPIFQKGTRSDGNTATSRTENTQSAVKQWMRLRNDGPNQRIIDAGQRTFGATVCNQCGLLYHAKDPDDEILHAKLHDNLNASLKFPGWKNENVIRNYGAEGQVIVITPRDAAHCWRKVNDVLSKVVDAELGFVEIGIRKPDFTRVYFYIADKKIVGVLVAERISRAYHILPADKENNKSRCCSDLPASALVGISRIWTLGTHRRLKVATRLVDSMRSDFVYGRVIDVSEMAFSDPTENGICFAEKYTKRDDFLVYNM